MVFTLMRGRIDIHGFERRLERAERGLHNPLSERNVELIKRFERVLFSSGIGSARVAHYLNTLRKLAEMLGKDFDSATKQDIEDLVYRIERGDYSAFTKSNYKVVLKRFYRWLKGGDEEYPEEVRWIKTTPKAKDVLLPEDLLTEEDIRKLVEVASGPRDKAFVMTLYESGARIGELGSLRIRDVQFEEGYAQLMLRGKKGSRRAIVVASVPYLATWIQNHPLKQNPDAPLWVSLGTVNRGKAMTYPAFAKVLRVTAERAGLRKKVRPHKLRHSRATFLANKLTEAQMNQLFGWKQGSRMPSIYVHLSGRDVDETILGLYGLKKPEVEQPKLVPRVCPRCQTSNPFDAKFCARCGAVLDLRTAVQLEEARREGDQIFDKLLEDPEVRALLARKIAQLA